MEQSKIDMFVMSNNDKFTPEQISVIKEKLANASDEKASAVLGQAYRGTTTMLLISIFLGSYGVDRFMLGDTTMGIIKLLTCGGAGIWWLIDLFKIKEKTYAYNFKKFNEVL